MTEVKREEVLPQEKQLAKESSSSSSKEQKDKVGQTIFVDLDDDDFPENGELSEKENSSSSAQESRSR